MKNVFASIPWPGWAFIVVTSFLFYFVPEIDLWVSDLFYSQGVGFTAGGMLWETILYESVKPLLILFYVGALILWLINRVGKKKILGFTGRSFAYVLLVLAVGSGLIVNATFKENWGRARPYQTVVYGGEKPFSPAFLPMEQRGYSFSCGHASGAFALLAFAMLAHRRRRLWIGAALTYGLLVGLARIASGGHFFSDVMVSLYVMYICSALFHALLFEKEATDGV